MGLSVKLFFSCSVYMHCVGVRVSLPMFALLRVSEQVCLKNGIRCGRDGGGMGKTQRSAITLKHAGPYLCHEA